MIRSKLLWIAVLAGAALVGCSSKPTALSIQKDEVAVAEARAEAERKRLARATEEAERYLKKVPAWVSEPPRADGVNVYAVGSGQSSRLDLAQKKAHLTGEFGLAKQYRQALSGSERLYQRDGNIGGGVQERYTLLIDKLVDRVHLIGHEVVRSETVVVDGNFHSWVLMKLSFEDMERLVARQKAESVDAAIDRQFDELDRRLKDYRAEQRDAATKAGLPVAGVAAAPTVAADPASTAVLPVAPAGAQAIVERK